jgi:hypothetical protein
MIHTLEIVGDDVVLVAQAFDISLEVGICYVVRNGRLAQGMVLCSPLNIGKSPLPPTTRAPRQRFLN